MKPPSIYKFFILEVKKIMDGDTIRAVIDVGFRTTQTQRIRLAIIQAPERKQPGFWEATNAMTTWLRANEGYLMVETYEEDDFGRWVGHIYNYKTKESVSEVLLKKGLVVPYEKK